MQTQTGLKHNWTSACTGETGIACFDAWAKELHQTGYLHNHTRMWFASIWIFTLRLPWELGADFFLRHLLDGDPASNTLGWRWVAGLQTAGKTYLARPDNIEKYTQGRFCPTGLATEAAAVAGASNPERGFLPAIDPIDPALITGLLMHDKDLDLGILPAQA
ncbi:MAG: FAD-binding domain-containing protein [Rhodobacterales bacterium]